MAAIPEMLTPCSFDFLRDQSSEAELLSLTRGPGRGNQP